MPSNPHEEYPKLGGGSKPFMFKIGPLRQPSCSASSRKTLLRTLHLASVQERSAEVLHSPCGGIIVNLSLRWRWPSTLIHPKEGLRAIHKPRRRIPDNALWSPVSNTAEYAPTGALRSASDHLIEIPAALLMRFLTRQATLLAGCLFSRGSRERTAGCKRVDRAERWKTVKG